MGLEGHEELLLWAQEGREEAGAGRPGAEGHHQLEASRHQWQEGGKEKHQNPVQGHNRKKDAALSGEHNPSLSNLWDNRDMGVAMAVAMIHSGIRILMGKTGDRDRSCTIPMFMAHNS